MNSFRADLHIHTVLSPCADLNMSPGNIIAEAERTGLDIIGITDHNTTRHCRLIKRLAERSGIFTLAGAEITTAEEVHCLVFFEEIETIDEFQEFIDGRLPDIKNVPELFGHQVQVNEKEEIIYTEEKMLLNALRVTINELEAYVHHRNGLFIPAHIDRMKNSIYSQLGFLPAGLKADALEVSRRSDPEKFRKDHPETNSFTVITGSDAHFTQQVGTYPFNAVMEKRSFSELRLALHGREERRITLK